MVYKYYAIIRHDGNFGDNGPMSVEFPDLHLTTSGSDMVCAIGNAKFALERLIETYRDDGELQRLPKPSGTTSIQMGGHLLSGMTDSMVLIETEDI